jgi:hypothetical protein
MGSGFGKCGAFICLSFSTRVYFLCFAKESNKERRLFANGSAGKKKALRCYVILDWEALVFLFTLVDFYFALVVDLGYCIYRAASRKKKGAQATSAFGSSDGLWSC